MHRRDPSLGGLTVRFVEAEYDADYVTGAMDTYCMVWLLEKTRWKRRKSRVWGRAQGDPMHPEWEQEFEFYDVRDDAKAVIDVWNKQVGGEADQFLGKERSAGFTQCAPLPALSGQRRPLSQAAASCSWLGVHCAAQRGMRLTSPLGRPHEPCTLAPEPPPLNRAALHELCCTAWTAGHVAPGRPADEAGSGVARAHVRAAARAAQLDTARRHG